MAQSQRQLQKAATKEKILQTAMSLYLGNGIATTTDAVAREAGLSHGTIFVHFPTREDLFLQVLTRFAQEMGDKLHALSALDRDLAELLTAHLEVLEEYEGFYTELIAEMATLPVDARNIVISLQSIVSRHFNTAIERGQQEGSIKTIPLHMLFNTWLGVVHYYLLNAALFAPEGAVLKRYKNDLVNNFLLLISE